MVAMTSCALGDVYIYILSLTQMQTTDGARASETPTPSAAGDDSEETAEGIIAPATLSSTTEVTHE